MCVIWGEKKKKLQQHWGHGAQKEECLVHETDGHQILQNHASAEVVFAALSEMTNAYFPFSPCSMQS